MKYISQLWPLLKPHIYKPKTAGYFVFSKSSIDKQILRVNQYLKPDIILYDLWEEFIIYITARCPRPFTGSTPRSAFAIQIEYMD